MFDDAPGKRFNKDLWIQTALRRRYLVAKPDGTILRAVRASADGKNVSEQMEPVKYRIHRKTGRVYFQLTWLGITKSVLVNRVIALAFLPNPKNLPQVNHKDGNKENNAVSNLEWSSGSDNERHAHRTGLKTGRGSANANAKLTVDDVLEIRASADPIEELVERFGVARSTIVNIRKRRTWTHV